MVPASDRAQLECILRKVDEASKTLAQQCGIDGSWEEIIQTKDA